MFSTIQRLYNSGNGPLTIESVKNAVKMGWITTDQYKEITDIDYTESPAA